MMLRWLIPLLASLLALSARVHAGQETPYGIDWLYPSSSTYVMTSADNGRGLSAFNAGGTLTITLPPNVTTLFQSWHMCAVNDGGHTVTVNVNVTAGGHILVPKPSGAASVTTISTSSGDYEMVCLIYDTSGNFRINWASPQTEISLGMLVSGSGTVPSCPINTIPYYASGGTTLSCLPVVNNALVSSGPGGVPSEDAARMGMLNAASVAVLGGSP